MWKKIVKFLKEKVWEPVEDFFVGLWDEIKEWAKEPWAKFKAWFLGTALPWLIKGWYQIVNMIILFILYGGIPEDTMPFLSAVAGLWLFVLLGYYIFWKLLGFDKAFAKRRKKRK